MNELNQLEIKLQGKISQKLHWDKIKAYEREGKINQINLRNTLQKTSTTEELENKVGTHKNERQKKNQQQLYSGQSLYSFTSKSAILHSHWKPEGIQPDQTIHVLFQACLRYVPAFTNVTVTDGMLSLSVILHPAFQIHFKIHFPETTQTKESLPFSKITGLINSITVLNLIICKCVFL